MNTQKEIKQEILLLVIESLKHMLIHVCRLGNHGSQHCIVCCIGWSMIHSYR